MNLKKAISTLPLAALIIAVACNKAYTPNVTVVPNPLEVHGDSVAFDVTGTLPLKKLKKKRVYTVEGTYKYGDQKIKVGELEYKGTEFPKAKTEAPTLSRRFSFAYKPEIGNGDLVVVGTNYNLDKTKGKSSPEFTIAKGLITTSRLVQNYYHVAYAHHGYNDQEELIPTNVVFYFEQGKSKLRKSEMQGEQGKFLDAFIAQKNVTRTVSIIGTHSPEGTERKNAQLADERAKVIEKYYKERMKVFNQKNWIDSIKFVTKGIILDWEPLRKELAKGSSLTSEEKNQINNIINGSGSFESKEAQLQKLPLYKKLFKEVYPKLRNAKTEILTVKPKKSKAEISLLAKQITEGKANLDALSEEELLYAATLTPILREKEAIYKEAVKKSGSWVANNNLGAVYLDMAKREIDQNQRLKLADMAANALNMSLNRKDNPEAHCNLAAVHLMKGVRTSAQDEINKAMNGASDDLKKGLMAMQGVLDIKNGKYDMAVQNLSKSGDSTVVLFNLALANLLKKDFNAAKGGFNTVVSRESNNAWGYYLLAVTAARQQDETGVVSNLKKAVSYNKSLVDKALGDMEFFNYWNSENFRNALK
ncbi:MAG: OmpA family protein [Cytophagaceae bacterium]|nr:OmpA family protein [Cytophagaceae bacterium]MDW8457124.1 OmpA family protein [Cytophagaceae bacterium]